MYVNIHILAISHNLCKWRPSPSLMMQGYSSIPISNFTAAKREINFTSRASKYFFPEIYSPLLLLLFCLGSWRREIRYSIIQQTSGARKKKINKVVETMLQSSEIHVGLEKAKTFLIDCFNYFWTVSYSPCSWEMAVRYCPLREDLFLFNFHQARLFCILAHSYLG